jgi:hypothetical protein
MAADTFGECGEERLVANRAQSAAAVGPSLFQEVMFERKQRGASSRLHVCLVVDVAHVMINCARRD